MVKLHISFGSKDESGKVFIKEEGNEKVQLTFDVIKQFAKQLLSAKVAGKDCTFEVIADDADSTIHKETVETTLNSVLTDEELLKLYKEETKGPDDMGPKKE